MGNLLKAICIISDEEIDDLKSEAMFKNKECLKRSVKSLTICILVTLSLFISWIVCIINNVTFEFALIFLCFAFFGLLLCADAKFEYDVAKKNVVNEGLPKELRKLVNVIELVKGKELYFVGLSGLQEVITTDRASNITKIPYDKITFNCDDTNILRISKEGVEISIARAVNNI